MAIQEVYVYGQNTTPYTYTYRITYANIAVSELMASCVCRFLGSAAFNFLDGVIEAEAVIPSGVFILLLCPHYYGVASDIMVEQGGCVV
jgi:hypothetical protein